MIMNKIIEELTDYYVNKNIVIYIDKEDDLKIKLIVKTKFLNKKDYYIEDLEIKKDFITNENKEIIKNGINYLIHNSLDRFLRGE